MIGQTLAHYRITAAIGAGGMGEVYRATDTKLGREVALKVLPAEMATSSERLERFQREAKALAALDHPGIVTVHSVEEAGGVHFLTMQLVEGQALDRVIPESGLPLERLLDIGGALADALAAAHEKGIVHRDLKPANVMVSEDGRVKVLDFGLAKVTGPQFEGPTDSELPTDLQTRDGVALGTVPYMSPEQVEGRAVDHRTDIFSLGVLLYEMATGRRPFEGRSTAELASAILRDAPPVVTEVRSNLPGELARIVRRCLEKDTGRRFQTVRDVGNELRDMTAEPPKARESLAEVSRSPAADGSGAARLKEGFWIAVLPFKHRGTDPALEALAEGFSEEIVTGLSRFSYLRVIARSSTARYANEAVDVRSVSKELGARYVMEGSVRQAGSALRIAVQLVDASSGAHLWAETYNRPFRSEEIFELQDDLVPVIVSTVADTYGVLAHTMSEALRNRPPDQLTPYEALGRSFGYYQRVTLEEHAEVRSALEQAVQEAPGHADCWAQLSILYADEYHFDFNAQPDPLGRALDAAQRAVAAAPSNHLAYHALARVLYFRRELQAFREAAERAFTLNPMGGGTMAFLGIFIAFSGDWDRGLSLVERAMQLNPHHPGWYWFGHFWNAYRQGDYRGALEVALKINMPQHLYNHSALAAIYGKLGEKEAARKVLRELLALKPDFAMVARGEFEKVLFSDELLEDYIDGLRKAGLEIPATEAEAAESALGVAPPDSKPGSSSTAGGESTAVAIAVLPFSDMSADKGQQYLCEGMAEEIMNALVRIVGIRVASRTSAFRASQEGGDLAAIGRTLSVDQVLDGSIRTAGSRMRVTAQLNDVTTGYQVWSERYDREVEDVFAIQDEIAAGVVEAVKARLSSGEHAIPARPQVKNLEAYRHYLKGRFLRYTKSDNGGALREFGEAVRLDPSHGLSWVGVAECNVMAAHYCLIPTAEAYGKAKEALAAADRLRAESPEALYVEGMTAFFQWQWKSSDKAYRRALELQPSHALALGSYGVTLCARFRLDEALPLFERARAADPLAPFPCAITGLGLLATGRIRESERYFEDALTFEKENMTALWGSGTAQIALGRFDEGIATLERATARMNRGAFILGLLGWGLATAGRTDEARGVLEELQARPEPAPASASEAWLLGALGDADGAWELLHRAEEERQAFLVYTGIPPYDPLRDDSRFDALLERLGLPKAGRPPATA